MHNGKGKILFISSVDPTIGPGAIALDYYHAFQKGGYEIDFLTRTKVLDHPDIKYVEEKKGGRYSNLLFKLWLKVQRLKNIKERFIFYRRESQPPVKISKVLSKIGNDYSCVVIFFWQTLLSYKTVEAIYDKMKNPPKVVFMCADYSPMTGGCHFMGDCENYLKGCGNCPMLRVHSSHDVTYRNMKDRQRINAKIKPLVLGNSYMNSFIKRSPAMQTGARVENSVILINTDLFKPLDNTLLRKKYNIPEEKFIIFFGCQNLLDERKGMKYLIRSMEIFSRKLSEKDRRRILVVTAGNDYEDLKEKIPFEQKHFGYVCANLLPELYSIASVYLSPSINDAGPSMVNQAICCGTPVVAFEIGTALDVIQNTGAGICVPLKDCDLFAEAIHDIYALSHEEYHKMRKLTRETALRFHSEDAFIRRFNDFSII